LAQVQVTVALNGADGDFLLTVSGELATAMTED
jgi:hypothetical protein